jgi:hypothetical protein
VLFAVDQSLREGRNMQYANCIIRVDMPWGPGDLEQSFGRIFRFGQKNKVYIHIILAEQTQDMARFARVVSKMQQQVKANSDFDDDSDAFVFNMNLDTMTLMVARDSSFVPNGAKEPVSFQDALRTFTQIDKQEIERNKQMLESGEITSDMVEVATGKQLPGAMY